MIHTRRLQPPSRGGKLSECGYFVVTINSLAKSETRTVETLSIGNQHGSRVMALEEIKKRFVDEIKLRAYDDKYVDKNEEREILQVAIQQGISIDSARGALQQVCEHQGYVLESTLLKTIKDQVETAAGNDGKVDQKEFELIFQNVQKSANGKKNERELKKMIVIVMEDTGLNKVKTGWFSDWYAAMKKDLGM